MEIILKFNLNDELDAELFEKHQMGPAYLSALAEFAHFLRYPNEYIKTQVEESPLKVSEVFYKILKDRKIEIEI